MARVDIANLSKIFRGEPGGEICAVRNVSLAVADREFLVLVGPSGCGKSTTLRLIAGLEEISEGTISIDGRVVNATPPQDRDVAMVFQNYALYPHLTVFENLGFGLLLRKFPKAEIASRVQEAAEILGLAPLLHRRPGELSGGQRQRVAVGRALVRIGGGEERTERAAALGSAIVEPNAAGADDLYVRLPGGACVLITRGHVFTYWCDDGGACTGIIHRLPNGGGECDSLGCDDDLLG